MSSGKYAAPLHLELRPSRRLAVWLGVLHATTASVVFLAPLPLLAQVALSTVLIASALRSVRVHALHKGRRAVTMLVWDADDRWWLRCSQGDEQAATLLGDSLVQPLLMVLNFRIDGTRRRVSVVLLSDSLPAELLRQLRARLRITRAGPTGDLGG
jgi:hypothetical protein